MNCQKARNLISAYLDGELGGQEMLAIRHHLNGCAECSGEYESLLAVKRMFGKLSPKRPVDDLAVRICSRLDEVHVPFYVRLASAARNQFRAFPAGMRVGAAGIAVIAMLLMVRGGDVSVPRLASIPISSATLQAFADNRPMQYGAFAEGAPVAVSSMYQKDSTGWQPAASAGQLTHGSSTGGLILAEYK